MKDVTRRRSHVSRVNRMLPEGAIRKVYGLFGLEPIPLLKFCPKCREMQPYSNFYVKSYRQKANPSLLGEKDFRDLCIYHYDERENKRKSLKARKEAASNAEHFMTTLFGDAE